VIPAIIEKSHQQSRGCCNKLTGLFYEDDDVARLSAFFDGIQESVPSDTRKSLQQTLSEILEKLNVSVVGASCFTGSNVEESSAGAKAWKSCDNVIARSWLFDSQNRRTHCIRKIGTLFIRASDFGQVDCERSERLSSIDVREPSYRYINPRQ